MSIQRRTFVGTAGAFLGSALAGRPVRPSWPHQVANLVFRNARVYDGTGAPAYIADVAITGDRISQIGNRLDAPLAEVIDLDGLALAPGFIDIHSHTDLELLIDPRAESKVRQGVTTEVVGQDGNSIGPWGRVQFNETRSLYQARYGAEIDFDTLDGFFSYLERTPIGVNIASMIGHGTLRGFVVGTSDVPATQVQLDEMVSHIRQSVAAGACGISSGLEYIPGAFADLAEVTRVVQALSGTGLPYATHMRNEDDQLFAAIEEALNVARGTHVPVHLSHLKAQGERNWWKADAVLEMLQRASEEGIDVTYDRYPYVAYSTGLSSLFPVWARDGGTPALLQRLREPATAPRVEQAVRAKVAQLGSWDAVQVTTTATDSLAWARGRRLGSLAAEEGQEPYALLLRIVAGDRNRSGMVGFAMSEENTARFLSHPLGMICSDGSALATDGPLFSGTPHPRSYGTFPRVLRHYVGELASMELETAISKMTSMPARKLRLAGRGVIAPQAYADIIVFDPAAVTDHATFEQPHQYATGIHHVVANGQFTLRDSARTTDLPGRVLRVS